MARVRFVMWSGQRVLVAVAGCSFLLGSGSAQQRVAGSPSSLPPGIYRVLASDLGMGNSGGDFGVQLTAVLGQERLSFGPGMVHCAVLERASVTKDWRVAVGGRVLPDAACADHPADGGVFVGPFLSLVKAEAAQMSVLQADGPQVSVSSTVVLVGVRVPVRVGVGTTRGSFDLAGYARGHAGTSPPSPAEVRAGVIGRALSEVAQSGRASELWELSPSGFTVLAITKGEAAGVYSADIQFSDGVGTWPFVLVQGLWTCLEHENAMTEWMDVRKK